MKKAKTANKKNKADEEQNKRYRTECHEKPSNVPKHKIIILLSIYQPCPVSRENNTLMLIEFHEYIAMKLFHNTVLLEFILKI